MPIAVNAQSRCEQVFATLPSHQQNAWDQILDPINEMVARNLNLPPEKDPKRKSTLYLKGLTSYLEMRHLDHIKALEKYFGLKPGEPITGNVVKRIFSRYKKIMVHHKNVLMPKFIFELPNGELIGLEPGDIIHEGARIISRVLFDHQELVFLNTTSHT